MLRYRLRTTTVAVDREAIPPVALTMPPGTIVMVSDDLANATGFVEVEWNGKRIHMFAIDLRERGELIRTRTAAGGPK